MNNIIDDTMVKLATNTQDLFKFAYHLRRLDKNHRYTEKFMHKALGEDNILVDIFKSNNWVEDSKH